MASITPKAGPLSEKRGIKSCAGPACTNVAIGGANRDRLYVTESVTGTVLVADIGIL